MAPAEYFPDIIDEREFGDRYLFDTNVWIYLQGPYVNIDDSATISYGNLLKAILDDGGTVVANPIIISEFVKVFVSIQYNALLAEGGASKKPKEFRQTNEYKEIAESLPDVIFHFLNPCAVLDLQFPKSTYDDVAKDLVEATMEYNDGLLVEACKREGLTLVTHDYDFSSAEVPLLSANSRYRK